MYDFVSRTYIIFSKVTKNWVVKKNIRNQRSGIHKGVLSSTLESSPDLIPQNISPIKKPDKEEARENMKTLFKN